MRPELSENAHRRLLIVMTAALALALLLALTGCVSRTTTEYYPAPAGQLPDPDGKVRGPVSREDTETGFTVGTQGLGSYTFLPISIF